MENILKTRSLLKDRYRIKKLLFSGRFYNYYEAEDLSSKNVPVRIIELLLPRLPPPGRKVSEEQFLEQIDLYMTLSHPVLPAIIDGFYHGEAAYIIQKREEGISIEQYLSMAVNNFTVEDAVKLVTLIGTGLSYLYNRPNPIPFIHLDAAHVMIDDKGNVCLTGFGLHIFLDYYYSSTEPYAYCAPEVAEGKPFSVRSAVYSLGALFYNMITGSKFDIRRNDNPRLSEVIKEIPSGLEEAVAKALSKNPSQRFIDLENFMQKLRDVTAPPDSPPAPAQPAEDKAAKIPGEGTLQKETGLLVKRIVKGVIIAVVVMFIAAAPFFIRTVIKSKAPPGADYAYILSEEKDQVLIFAIKSANKLATVSFLGTAEAMALSCDGDRLFIARKERNILIADAKSGNAQGSFPIDDEPVDLIAVSPGPFLYLTCIGSSDITVWDSDGHATAAAVKNDVRYQRLSSSPDGSTVFAAGKDISRVAIIDTGMNEIKGTITSGAGTEEMAVSRDGSMLFLLSGKEKAFFYRTIDSTLAKEVLVEKGTCHVASSRGNEAPDCMYVASESQRSIVQLDCSSFSIARRIVTKGIPRSLAVSSNGKVLYAVTVFPERLELFDSVTLKPINDYPVPFRPATLIVH